MNKILKNLNKTIFFYLFKRLHIIYINFNIIENNRPLPIVKIGISAGFLDEFQKLFHTFSLLSINY